jgi:tetratricopeptide (TPR) repeat protein
MASAQNQPSASGQDVPIVQTPQQDPTADQPEQPPKPDTKDQKKPSKAKRKLRDAVPDCINIIFSKCWHNDARQQEAEEAAQERRAQAAKRCEAIEVARARRTPPPAPAPSLAPGESSSKSSQASLASPAGCTPDDVLEAEHDVDVGDTYAETGNKKAAEMRYRDALKALPDDPVATLHLARLLEKQGRKAEALELYRSYMTWSPTGKEAEEANKSIAKLGAEN